MSKPILAAVSAVIITLSMFGSTAASASESDERSVCTVGGVPVPVGQPAPADIPTVISCFKSMAEAEQFIEDGAPGDIEQLAAASPLARSASAATASTVTIGKVWTGTSRTGAVLIQAASV